MLMRQWGCRYVKSPILQFALRQMQAHFTRRGTWSGIVIVGGVLGLVGPFGTYGGIPVAARIAYWLAVAALSYGTGYAGGSLLAAALPDQLPQWLRIAIIGLVSGIPIALVVAGINWAVLGELASGLADLTTLLVYCPMIALAVTAALWLLPQGDIADPASIAEPAPPAILSRLSLPQRGRLLALSVSDHYVDVITDRGTTLLLLRLGDAIRETAPVAGVQIHRSHWVALAAVKSVGRGDGKAWVELENGQRLPVSRGYMSSVREAGLLV